MAKYDETIRRAKKETATTTMLFEATVQINDDAEFGLFDAFLDDLLAHRKDPFSITPEVKTKTEAQMKFDELVPADDPPEATSGPTWATTNAVQLPGNHTVDAGLRFPEGRIGGEYPTEDEAVAAFKKFAATHKAEESVALVKSFNVARVKELKPEQRASFIAEASRAT